MRRFGWVIGLKTDKIEEYKRLHADVWPTILDQIRQSNIRNYSIYLRRLPDGHHYLFSYCEYIGTDFEADMVAMADDPETQKWWTVTKPTQVPFENRAADAWWADMEEVFHVD